jgi:FtsP/CotA-like multicopper oxidase with cupredoxin domain
MQWTINGGTYPDVPMFTVREGDVVRMTIDNRSGDSHPMHLHGHHVLVLSRDGVADNPGIWMDHCHNLPHATEGLLAHLVYEGVTTPYLLGHATGNEPE